MLGEEKNYMLKKTQEVIPKKAFKQWSKKLFCEDNKYYITKNNKW